MKLLTEEIKRKLPKLYTQEYVKDPMIWCKFFTPDSNLTFYPYEFDEQDLFFGLVCGHEQELGYFTLNELENTIGPMGLHIERDRSFRPMLLSEVRKLESGGR